MKTFSGFQNVQHCLSLLVTACCIWLGKADKHKVVYMGRTMDNVFTIDGASILTSYKQSHLPPVQWVLLMPPSQEHKFLIRFEDNNIPCPQQVTLRETDRNTLLQSSTTNGTILDHFCGSLSNFFLLKRGHDYLTTTRGGSGLHITWFDMSPRSQQSIIHILVTAFKPAAACLKEGFLCNGMCISPDLVCDGILHCLDGSDEHLNCTRLLANDTCNNYPILPEIVQNCTPEPCEEPSLHWGFHHSTLTLMIPMILALIFLSVAILWRNKRIIRRLLHDNAPAPRSAISFDSSEIATAEHETFYHAEIPEVCGGDPPSFDPDWGIQHPPPYSPRDEVHFTQPMHDPPPPYHTIIDETAQNTLPKSDREASEPMLHSSS